jgi:lipoate-protein ligase B
LGNKRFLADYLGVMEYGRALEIQQAMVRARTEKQIPDVVLLLEHPPVFTTGYFRGEEDIVVPSEALVRENLAVFRSNRGGRITYHGPGQLVCYPVLDLKENGIGVHKYVWRLEEVVVKTLLIFDIHAHRREKYRGVWVGEKKVCSLGIHVSRHVTMHGLALNVNNDLRYFEYIKPCGIGGRPMTSVSRILRKTVTVSSVIESLLLAFSDVFDWKCERGLSECLNALAGPNG